MDVGAVKAPTIRRSQVMQTITTIGLDIAKSPPTYALIGFA
jgi:hypothetical protein